MSYGRGEAPIAPRGVRSSVFDRERIGQSACCDEHDVEREQQLDPGAHLDDGSAAQ
jgi:hypothetical protein